MAHTSASRSHDLCRAPSLSSHPTSPRWGEEDRCTDSRTRRPNRQGPFQVAYRSPPLLQVINSGYCMFMTKLMGKRTENCKQDSLYRSTGSRILSRELVVGRHRGTHKAFSSRSQTTASPVSGWQNRADQNRHSSQHPSQSSVPYLWVQFHLRMAFDSPPLGQILSILDSTNSQAFLTLQEIASNTHLSIGHSEPLLFGHSGFKSFH